MLNLIKKYSKDGKKTKIIFQLQEIQTYLNEFYCICMKIWYSEACSHSIKPIKFLKFRKIFHLLNYQIFYQMLHKEAT